jgi:hypothetical protein
MCHQYRQQWASHFFTHPNSRHPGDEFRLKGILIIQRLTDPIQA